MRKGGGRWGEGQGSGGGCPWTVLKEEGRGKGGSILFDRCAGGGCIWREEGEDNRGLVLVHVPSFNDEVRRQMLNLFYLIPLPVLSCAG